MATLSELEDALRNADAAGDTDAARLLADEIVRQREGIAIDDGFGQTFEKPAVDMDEEFDDPPPVPTTKEILGLDPNVTERGVLLPFGVDKEGSTVFTPSEIMLDLLDALFLPGRVLQGHQPTDKEIINFTAATAGSAPKNAISAVRSTIKPTPEAGSAAATAARRTAEDMAATDPTKATAEAARAARFNEQGIPTTKGDLTQNFTQQATEQRLMSMATGEAGEPLRLMKLNQSEIFQTRVNELVDSLGVPKETGDSIKAALQGRKDLLRTQKTALYKQVGEAAPEVTNTPLMVNDIILSIPDAKTVRRLRTLAPAQVKAVDDLLVEFGLDTGTEAVEAFVKSGGEITPLTLGNFDDFRIALNQIERSDQSGAVKVITGKIKDALDREAVFIDDALKESGITDQGVVELLKQARARVRQIKTEFSPQSITGRLIDVKRDGVTPVIEASKVTNQLLSHNVPIENLERTLKSLGGSAKGKKAIGDLQASVVMDALEAGLKAPSRKTAGIETVGGNQFAKHLDKFGDDKLALLFKDQPEALEALHGLKQTALDISPTAGAVPKGSAPVLLDLFNRAARLPGLAAVRDTVVFVAQAGGDERAVARALKNNPQIKETIVQINRRYPAFANNVGLVSLLNKLTASEESEPRQ